MLVGNKPYRTIWLSQEDPTTVEIIDQRWLPFEFKIEKIDSVEVMAVAIRDMHVRGAGLIGASAGYGMYLAAIEIKERGLGKEWLYKAGDMLTGTRPTAVNLEWAVRRQLDTIKNIDGSDTIIATAKEVAQEIADEDARFCQQIGVHGVSLIEDMARKKKNQQVNVLTHCNAGWLAFVDYGSATAPIYEAHKRGLDVHVWVDETRPRNQGASLTAWELKENGIPHTVIADNTGGHLMQHGMVDLVIVGSDRTTYTGDVANKIGTYLKALAAHDNNIPFYAALPSSTIDWNISNGIEQIPIEQRDPGEVSSIQGRAKNDIISVQLVPEGSPAVNYGFDVTPARLITGLITEKGICHASEEGVRSLFHNR